MIATILAYLGGSAIAKWLATAATTLVVLFAAYFRGHATGRILHVTPAGNQGVPDA